MAGCNRHELGQISGDGERQERLASCSSWGCKESHMTGQLNNNKILLDYCLAHINKCWLLLFFIMI